MTGKAEGDGDFADVDLGDAPAGEPEDQTIPGGGVDGDGGVGPDEAAAQESAAYGVDDGHEAQASASGAPPVDPDLARYAEIGKRYAPYSGQIDALMARAFDPTAAAQGQTAPQSPAGADPFDTYFGGKQAQEKFWEQVRGGDLDVFPKAIQAIVKKTVADIEKRQASYEKKLEEHYNHILRIGEHVAKAPFRYQENPRYKIVGPKFDEKLRAGYPSVEEAWRVASLEATAAGANPAQAAAAGRAAATAAAGAQVRKIGGTQAPQRPTASAAARAAPRRDATATVTRANGGHAKAPQFDKDAPNDWIKAIVSSSVAHARTRESGG